MLKLPIRSSSGEPGNHRSALVVAAIISALLVGCDSVAESESPSPAPVRVATALPEPTDARESYVGVVEPRYKTDLGFRVAGKIVARRADVGEAVSAGQLLVQLDATDFRLNVEAQEAELKAALSSRDQAVAAAERYRRLLANGHVSVAAFDQRVAAAEEAKARAEHASRALELARNQLSYTNLIAPHDGVVTELLVETGQVVAAGQSIVRVARLDEIEAVVALPEQKVKDARTAIATVKLWAHGGREYPAVLREIAPVAEAVSRTYEARFSIKARDAELALGMTVSVQLQWKEPRRIIRLPLNAVTNDGRGAIVWVVDEGTGRVRRTPVDVLSFGQQHALIASGLPAGVKVVALGAHLLDEGRPVHIIENQPTFVPPDAR